MKNEKRFRIPGPLISPSLLSADQTRILDEVRAAESVGVEWLHVDVMDGQFVPNLTFGVPLVAALRPKTEKFLDCHLMVNDPEKMIPWFADAGADGITIHSEAVSDLEDALKLIRATDCAAGVSIKPQTSVSEIESALGDLDLVLVMSVNPGFSGQKFMPEVLEKVTQLCRLREARGLEFRIQIDGGIGNSTIAAAWNSGAEIFVAGNAFFGASDRKSAFEQLMSVSRK